jgi:hypothetical protein
VRTLPSWRLAAPLSCVSLLRITGSSGSPACHPPRHHTRGTSAGVARVLSSALSASLPAAAPPAVCARRHTLHETHISSRHTDRAATHHASHSRIRIADAPARRTRHARGTHAIPSHVVMSAAAGTARAAPTLLVAASPVRLSRRHCCWGEGGGGGGGRAAHPPPPLSPGGAASHPWFLHCHAQTQHSVEALP